MGIQEWVALALSVVGALGLRELLARFVDRKARVVANDQVTAQTAKTEVETIRSVLEEVRAQEARKAERIDKLERRVDLLEHHERETLTLIAIHQGWDQIAYQTLLAENPGYPPPPTLIATPMYDPLGTKNSQQQEQSELGQD